MPEQPETPEDPETRPAAAGAARAAAAHPRPTRQAARAHVHWAVEEVGDGEEEEEEGPKPKRRRKAAPAKRAAPRRRPPSPSPSRSGSAVQGATSPGAAAAEQQHGHGRNRWRPAAGGAASPRAAERTPTLGSLLSPLLPGGAAAACAPAAPALDAQQPPLLAAVLGQPFAADWDAALRSSGSSSMAQTAGQLYPQLLVPPLPQVAALSLPQLGAMLAAPAAPDGNLLQLLRLAQPASSPHQLAQAYWAAVAQLQAQQEQQEQAAQQLLVPALLGLPPMQLVWRLPQQPALAGVPQWLQEQLLLEQLAAQQQPSPRSPYGEVAAPQQPLQPLQPLQLGGRAQGLPGAAPQLGGPWLGVAAPPAASPRPGTPASLLMQQAAQLQRGGGAPWRPPFSPSPAQQWWGGAAERFGSCELRQVQAQQLDYERRAQQYAREQEEEERRQAGAATTPQPQPQPQPQPAMSPRAPTACNLSHACGPAVLPSSPFAAEAARPPPSRPPQPPGGRPAVGTPAWAAAAADGEVGTQQLPAASEDWGPLLSVFRDGALSGLLPAGPP